ncbi:hypothetical protein HK103_005898 [Boothiomyces macroporosus]|uniref:Tetratricopeptide repeat protein n=1 Tax=Boothiomyces macroporosus TaxID=261099 RepID=A0AAD5UF86_9FUNG|nr:hypothetical protein HK103_005898 [Boothiomyces macroporosus]
MIRRLFLKRVQFKSFASLPSKDIEKRMMDAQIIFNQGIEKWNQDDMIGAKVAFEQSIKSHPTSDAWFNLANVYQTIGNYEKALEYWKKSIELSPRPDAHVNIANVKAIFQKDPIGAIPHYESALKLTPTDGEIRYNYGVVLDSCGKLEEAVEQYELAVMNGIELAEKNLRNAKARLLAKKINEQEPNKQ